MAFSVWLVRVVDGRFFCQKRKKIEIVPILTISNLSLEPKCEYYDLFSLSLC